MLTITTFDRLRWMFLCFTFLVLFSACQDDKPSSNQSEASSTRIALPESGITPQYVFDHKNKGIELLTSLPKEIQESIKFRIGSKPHAIDAELLTFQGKVNNPRAIGLNGKIQTATTYTLKNAVTAIELSYDKLKAAKNKDCYKEKISFNEDGQVIQIGNSKYSYQDGKINSHQNNTYTYSDNKLEINYPSSKDRNFSIEYIFSKDKLSMQSYLNGSPAAESIQVKYNNAGQRVATTKTKKGWKVESKFSYDENNRLINMESLEQFLNEDGSVRKEDLQLTEYKYDENDLVIQEGFTSKLMGEKVTNDGRFYFFKNDENGLNIYILECDSSQCPDGVLEHYIFNKKYNLVYYSSRLYPSKRYMVAYFNEYEYYF